MIDARLDLNRRQRLGMVEAVWGEHKTAEQIIAILQRFAAADELGLVTRVSPEKADAVLSALPAVAVVICFAPHSTQNLKPTIPPSLLRGIGE